MAIRDYKQVQVGTRDVQKTRRVQVGTRDVQVPKTKREQTGTRQVPITKTRQVQTGTRKVKVGVKNLGNGYFEDVYKDEPVYSTQTYTEYKSEPVYEDRSYTEYKTEPIYEDRTYYETKKEPVYENQSYVEAEPVYERQPIHAPHYTYEVPEWIPRETASAEGRDASPTWPRVDEVPNSVRAGGRSESFEVIFDGPEEMRAVHRPASEDVFRRFTTGSRWTGSLYGSELQGPVPAARD